ncbi:hypothetical protein BN1051_03295 [Arthrobacter saudimassiliensis]|uniref:Uncharacterized protein n=1 Tax=Arthrobacter saudimassiliensis TaxID=1461584 RepID=A0A078MU85_9MICC|nr:hypothetical protein BN1051_03295 [Arthrobacter saudimassiliensis]
MQFDPIKWPGRQRSLMHRVPGNHLFGRLTRLGTFPLVMLLLLLLGIAGLLQLAEGDAGFAGASPAAEAPVPVPEPPAGLRG